jgi:predicted nicotinamide N-methyase
MEELANMNENEKQAIRQELNQLHQTYERYLRNGLYDKARYLLPKLNELEGLVADLEED